ncbi:uncharacterized protein LOC118449110 [Vespa mandarinia]|uniref:uncharacterized protein LOC118449110 n=1 Tax=Vespa mandarinia TaxID=7446 RepID=UPI0016133F6E|nr:uncharacterized protein LOC118449110 [Vespa mandarinia]
MAWWGQSSSCTIDWDRFTLVIYILSIPVAQITNLSSERWCVVFRWTFSMMVSCYEGALQENELYSSLTEYQNNVQKTPLLKSWNMRIILERKIMDLNYNRTGN